MQHSIFINPNHVIEIHIIGEMTAEDVSNLGQQVVSNMTRLERDGRKVDILIDYSRGTNTEDLAVSLAKVVAKGLPFRRVAGYEANENTIRAVTEVIKATSLGGKIRLFATRAEAETWLAENGN